ncbi:Efflux pump roqT-like protein 1 [Elsinoe fawcettii]|nr:Efflux pump roqT-like protein 1 [Elsinoe fawcettii]
MASPTKDTPASGSVADTEKQLTIDGSNGREDVQKTYPPFKVVLPTMICLCLAFFLAALDRTIVGVAVPAISDEFQSFGDIGWYQTGFTLTNCVFQLPVGKIYRYFAAKWVIITSVVIFEVGSVVCAAAPSSVAFIIGRAITGIGAAGILVGTQIVIRDILPLQERPKWQSLLGATFGLSSVLGPILGGAFTTHVSWRWCLWISLPIGGVALAGLVLILPTSPASEKIEGSWLEAAKKFDPLGNACVFPGLICLLLSLQWGGLTYPWKSVQVIVPLVLGILLLIALILVQLWVQENGTAPPRIVRQRTIAAGALAYIGVGAVLVIAAFYLPIWFQVVQGITASEAGLRLIPYFLSTVIFAIISGVAVSKIGYYTPFLIFGSALLIAGNGAFTSIHPGIGKGEYIGFQILLGSGVGLCLQQPINAAQTVLADRDIPTGITVLTFAQILGSTVFVSICQAIVSQTLKSELARGLPGFDASSIGDIGATDIRKLVSTQELLVVLAAYNSGIRNVFYCTIGASVLALGGSLALEWRTVRTNGDIEDRRTGS